jgi:DNA-binding response OmpR family regulator
VLKPEIISLDANLSGKNGFQILRELKAEFETQYIPVIMIAAVEHRQMGLDLGAASFLPKPSSAEEIRKALSELEAKYTLAPAKVMVVDDEPEVGYMLDMLLSSADFQFSLMYNPFTALEALAASPPDIVVVDLTMPVMDGFEFVRRVRDHAHLQDLPIIVFTATMVVGDDAKFLRAHVQAIVQKGGLSNMRALAAELHRLRKGSLTASS